MRERLQGQERLKKIQDSMHTTLSRIARNRQNDHDHQNEDHSDAVLDITNVTLTNPVSRSSKNENGTFNITTVADDHQDDAHADAEQNGTNVSLTDIESHLPEKEEDGTFKASTANATYEIINEDDKPKNTTDLKHIASSDSTAQGVEIITTHNSTIDFETDDNTTAVQKPNISEVTTNLNTNDTTRDVQNDLTPFGAQVNHTHQRDDVVSTEMVNSTRSLTTAVLDSSSRVSHEETSLSTGDVCVAKCNAKRTLQRKRDACIKRCDSWAASSSAPTLAKGYGSVKLEL